MIFQTARVENWTAAPHIDRAWKLIVDGKSEQALDDFVAADPVMRIRTHDLSQATFHRFATVNDLQLQLAKLPFCGAITTNYDCLIERAGAPWAVDTGNVNAPAGALDAGSRLLVKLYGDFASASPLILGRKDFRAALGRNPDFVKAFASLFQSRPIFFVGTSLEGLLADLELLEGVRPTGVQHYCVTGVAFANWRASATQLKTRYNVEVLACDVLNIQRELKSFMAELVEAVDQQTAKRVPEQQEVS
jgi:hypothetical protein